MITSNQPVHHLGDKSVISLSLRLKRCFWSSDEAKFVSKAMPYIRNFPQQFQWTYLTKLAQSRDM